MKRMRMGLHLVALAALAVGLSGGFQESLGFWEDEGVAVVEYIRPGGACTDPPSVDNGASALHGWKLPAAGLTYKVATGSVPSGVTQAQFVDAVTSAASEWDANTGATLLTYGGTVTKDKDGIFNNQSSVQYGGQVPLGAIAVAWVRVVEGTVQEIDIRLSKSFKWAYNDTATGNCGGADGKMDLRDILVHEWGHGVGAAHTSANAGDNAQTMFPYASYKELLKRSLANGDKASLQAIYP